MKSFYTLVGVALVLATLTTMTVKPALAASSLTVNHTTINQGGTVMLTQSETKTGIVKSFKVTLPDGGGVCTAPGGAVSNGHPLSRTFPNDFTPVGGASCSTSLAGTYIAETVVANGNSKGGDGEDKNNQDNNQGSEGDHNSGVKHGDDNEANDNEGDNNGGDDGEGGDSHVCKTEFDTSFMVLPETSLGAAGLIGTSLAALGGFLYLRKPF